MMTAETGESERGQWIANLDEIAALEPAFVVVGDKKVDNGNNPKIIGESQQYLRDFTRIAAQETTAAGIVARTTERYPDWENLRTLWHSGRTAIAEGKLDTNALGSSRSVVRICREGPDIRQARRPICGAHGVPWLRRDGRVSSPPPGFEFGTDGPSLILVGVDGSRTSLRAAAYAGGLARRQGCRLLAV